MKELYYVPVIQSSVDVLKRMPAEIKPGIIRPFVESSEQAKEFLNDMRKDEIEIPMGDGIGPIGAQTINAPWIHSIYSVEAPMKHSNGCLSPDKICFVGHTILPDYLHNAKTINESVPVGSKGPSNEELNNTVTARLYALQKLQNAINRTSPEDRSLINLNDPQTQASLREAFAVDGFVQGSSKDLDFASKVLQKVEREMADEMTVKTLSYLSDAHAKFTALLEAPLDEPMPNNEKIAMALSITITIFIDKVPAVDAVKMGDMKTNIREYIYDAAHEAELG